MLNISGAVLSATNGGIFLAIGAMQPLSGAVLDENAPLLFDRSFVWEPFSNVGDVELLYPKAEFGIRVKMLDPNGRETPRTSAGKECGSKFDAVRTLEDVVSGTTMGRIDARHKYVERGRGFSGGTLPAPEELFLMEKPGIYSLYIEMQMFRNIKTNQSYWDTQLIKFPSVEIKVEKPPTAQFFVFSATNHGVCLEIMGTKSNSVDGFDDNLRWRPVADDNMMLHGLDLAYGFKMNLRGPDGKAIAKKGLGETIGSRFDSVKTFRDLPKGTQLTYLNIVPDMPLNTPEQPFPVLNDCFAMDKRGIYTMELQMQLFRIIDKEPYGPEPEEVLRFPPMKIKVNRP